MSVILLVVYVSLLGVTVADVSYSSTACGDNCVSSECPVVNNSACDFANDTFDVHDLLGQLPCKQCTQSSASTCSLSQIKDDYDTSQFWAIYCNDDYLVAWSKGVPKDQGLDDIPRPPGEGGDYASNCVVRTAGDQFQIYKFPLTAATGSKTYFASATTNSLAGCSGMAKNGVPIYPFNNDTGDSVWKNCEADYCNAHAGKGEDYHYHGDPYGSKCIYKDSDYSGDHPPKIGMGMDGYTIYGRHIRSGMEGSTVDLDDCNGHTHGSYGYHYHADQRQVTAQLVGTNSDTTYTEYHVGPSICWGGNINNISNFWDPNVVKSDGTQQVNYDMSKSNPKYCPRGRSDYEQLRPCCGSTEYYVEDCGAINTKDGECASSNGCGSSTSYVCTSTSGTCITDGGSSDGSSSEDFAANLDSRIGFMVIMTLLIGMWIQ